MSRKYLILPLIILNVKQASSVKSLGLNIVENLNWESDINILAKKIASGIKAIEHIRNFAPCQILLTAYNALVQPHFDYCSAA